MVLGIVSLAIPGVGLITGIIAIVLGAKFKKNNPYSSDYTKAKAGVIMGSISVGFQALVSIFAIIFVVSAVMTGLNEAANESQTPSIIYTTTEYSPYYLKNN